MEECPRRQYECPHCQEAGEYQERTTKHLNECLMVEVPCPNHGCKIHITRWKLSKHCQECPLETVSCKYETIGCKHGVIRRDLEKHERDSQHHLQLAIDTVHQLKSKLAHLQSREMPMKYKFTKYDHHKAANDSVYSPPFYTSPGGYKMCVCVDANGIGEGKGTHISVYAHLMKGENDNHLPWPFTGHVTIELLNQLDDENHSCMHVMFPPDGIASRQVVNEEISSNALGHPRYVSHSDLGYNPAKNCQYLMDDCLYFRISVDAKSSSKPWLV